MKKLIMLIVTSLLIGNCSKNPTKPKDVVTHPVVPPIVATKPNPPTSVTAVPTASTHAILVSWVASTSTDVTGYRVYRSTATFTDTTGKFIGIVTGNNTVDIVPNLQTYYYRLTAKNSWGLSDLSNEASSVPSGMPIPPKYKVMFGVQKASLLYTFDFINLDGSAQYSISTNFSYGNSTGIWSADGKKIAYIDRPLYEPFNTSIHVMNPDGSNDAIISTAQGSIMLSWAPNGNSILIMHYNSNSQGQLQTINPDGTNLTMLTNDTLNCQISNQAPWSPDGSKITFASSSINGYEIWIMSADGTNKQQLTHDGVRTSTPTWSPDGKKIGFTSNSTGIFQAWTINSDGTEETNLSNSVSQAEFLNWSPDGTKILFLSVINGDDIWSMNSDGSSQKQLTFGTGNVNNQPNWSPDGTKIVFVSQATTGSTLTYIMNPDGTDQHRLSTSENRIEYSPRISPYPVP